MVIRKWLMFILLLISIAVISGSLLYFLPKSYIEKSNIPGLNALKQKISSATLKSEYELIVKNENPQLRVLKNPVALFPPNDEIKQILDYNGVKKVTFVITDVPQVQKNIWDENGQKLEYSSFNVLQPTTGELEVFLYLNKELIRKYKWSDRNIANYINFAFFTAVVSQADRNKGFFDPMQRAKEIMDTENNLPFTFKDV